MLYSPGNIDLKSHVSMLMVLTKQQFGHELLMCVPFTGHRACYDHNCLLLHACDSNLLIIRVWACLQALDVCLALLAQRPLPSENSANAPDSPRLHAELDAQIKDAAVQVSKLFPPMNLPLHARSCPPASACSDACLEVNLLDRLGWQIH